MQHYGAPTRLLDFTFSPYVALYFALECGENDAALFCINHHAISEDDNECFGKDRVEIYNNIMTAREDELYLFSFEPIFSNQRLLGQQGILVASSSLELSHGEILNSYNVKSNDFTKYIIKKSLRYSGLRKLSKMNITSTNIYPGLEGFCKSMKWQPAYGLEWQRRVGIVN